MIRPRGWLQCGPPAGRTVAGAQGGDGKLRRAGAVVTGEPVEVDARIITARGPQHMEAFVDAPVKTLTPSPRAAAGAT